ncbi:small VCP/p97-interacting protein isoform X1 [Octopus bimaculoides]|uniref:Uncharacterized protein n=1 Tax=Octopus bimaculoides TaxID=37653 RepID=A0A0L8ICP2_OCTBM|nr:small VCP/p97-interacting protein isoform X1 [Octopus bimaculoides]|eukprot:XP_014776806.1 PREDICTED: small VCP/p97-interacting protein-like isoform X1 [Octopus bimaculoides]
MGLCCCFLRKNDHEDETNLNPDPKWRTHCTWYPRPVKEVRRRQMADAAEKRKKSQEYRGITDPEGYKRRQKKQQQLDELDSQPSENTNLRWQVD